MPNAPNELDQAWSLIKDRPVNVIAILGPYFGGGSHETISANIAEAEEYAIALANQNIGFFCPHTHTRHFETKSVAGEPFYHRLDLGILLRVADAALFTPRWRASSGARREQAWCEWRGLRCFFPESPKDLGAILHWNAHHQPYDRMRLEAAATEAANTLFDFSCLPGWNSRDAALQAELRHTTSRYQQARTTLD